MEPIKMGWWVTFLDSLDTGGGHIMVLFVLILVGAWMFFHDATAGGQIITLSFGALLALTKAVGSNREQIAKSTDPTTTSTAVVSTTSTTSATPPANQP